MDALTKIRLFRIVLWITYPIALVFLYPLALLRKKNKGHLFFFFDKYDLGGAQRININILNSVPDMHKQVYFTRTSAIGTYKDEFYKVPNTEVYEIQGQCENILLRIFSVHYYAFYINRHAKAHVFSAVSTFFFDMLPFLSKHVVRTELLHMFTNDKNGLEYFGLGNHQYLTWRMITDTFTYANIKEQYETYGVDASYLDRIKYVETGVDVPAAMSKQYELPLKVLYAGRGGPQKRVDRLDKIAKYCIEAGLPIEFHFAGNMVEELSEDVKSSSVIHGEIRDLNEMYRLYNNSHVMIMTSAFEGFPMAIKESMACGCVPVVTGLEGNKNHLKHGENAMLMDSLDDDNKLVQEGIDNLKALAGDMALLKRLSENAYQYASGHFDIKDFKNLYRKFFTEN